MRIEMVNLCLLFLYYNAINVRNICKFGVLERIHLLILVRVKFMIAISTKKDLEKFANSVDDFLFYFADNFIQEKWKMQELRFFRCSIEQ